MLGRACPGPHVTSQIPDELAVVLKVEHGQRLHGSQYQDLVAPQVGS